MKKLNVFAILLFLISAKVIAQENSQKLELRLSYITGVLGPVGRDLEMIESSAYQTSLINGYDLKMIVPTKRENFQWLLGTFYQDGEESNSETLIGGLYFGPQLSTHCKYVNFVTYISAGVFSVSDEIVIKEQNNVLYDSVSNYTAPGTKSGIGLSLSYKSISLTGGYQIFITSAKSGTSAYHGIEFGVGVKF